MGGKNTPSTLLVAGIDDEVFIAEIYEPMIAAQTDAGTYLLSPEFRHIDLLAEEALFEATSAWPFDWH